MLPLVVPSHLIPRQVGKCAIDFSGSVQNLGFGTRSGSDQKVCRIPCIQGRRESVVFHWVEQGQAFVVRFLQPGPKEEYWFVTALNDGALAVPIQKDFFEFAEASIEYFWERVRPPCLAAVNEVYASHLLRRGIHFTLPLSCLVGSNRDAAIQVVELLLYERRSEGYDWSSEDGSRKISLLADGGQEVSILEYEGDIYLKKGDKKSNPDHPFCIEGQCSSFVGKTETTLSGLVLCGRMIGTFGSRILVI